MSMEPRHAARMAREFIDQLFSDVDAFWKNDMPELKKMASTGKALEKVLSQFSNNPGILTSYLVLNKTKSYMMGIEFSKGDINPHNNKRKEPSIYSRNFCLGRKSAERSEYVLFSISQHCIHRIIERSECTNLHDPKTIHKHIYKQLEYLPIYRTGVTKIALMATELNFNESHLDSKAIVNNLDSLPVAIPTSEGILLGETNKLNIHIRTFLSDKEMTNEDLMRKRRLAKLLKPLKDSYVLYAVEYAKYFNLVQWSSADTLSEIVALELMQEFEDGLDNSKLELSKKGTIKRFFRMIHVQNDLTLAELVKREILDQRNEGLESGALISFVEKNFRKSQKRHRISLRNKKYDSS
jgi:hypothetical protein